jgi:hypothetical protein
MKTYLVAWRVDPPEDDPYAECDGHETITAENHEKAYFIAIQKLKSNPDTINPRITRIEEFR